MFEKYLGVLFIILKNNTNCDLSNILFNQQQMISLYDLHDTLLDMINIKNSDYEKNDKNKRQSLFIKINGKKRNCQTYKTEIKDNCFCKDY